MNSAAGKAANGNVSSVTDKLLRTINNIKRAKMSMQNQWKLLSQLRDYLNRTNYDKSQQINFSKDWLDTLQKLTYSQLDTIRKLSSSDSIKPIEPNKSSSNIKRKDSNDPENTRVTLVSDQVESLLDASARPKIQKVIIWKINVAQDLIFIYSMPILFSSQFTNRAHLPVKWK